MQQSSGSVTGRVVGVFAIIGFGLGFAALLFLWATDYFEAGGDDFGSAIFGGLALGAVTVFALLSGIIVAALGGLHAAHSARNRDRAVTSAFVAGLAGHIVMIAVLGGLMAGGLAALSPEGSEPEGARETTAPVDAECAQTFGADSPICRAGEQAPETPQETGDGDDGIAVEQLLKLGLGAIPAAVVGGLTAAVLFSPKEYE